MEKIPLTQVLGIPPAETASWKLSLSMHLTGDSSKRYINDILDNGLENVDLTAFSFHSHYAGKKNFKVGDKVLCFVQLEDRDKWLFTNAAVVTGVPDAPGPCEIEPILELAGFFGRLVMKSAKGNTHSRYVFKLDHYLSSHPDTVVEEILSTEFQMFKWEGYGNASWSFKRLLGILDSMKFAEVRAKLAEVKGVYVLTDTRTGKLYVGSAYGKEGIAQRWKCYLETSTGGNKGLKELYERLGPNYFKDNFKFTLLEWFDLKTPDSVVLARENYFKEALGTREHGYNCN